MFFQPILCLTHFAHNRLPSLPGLPSLPYLLKRDGKDLVKALTAKEWLVVAKMGALIFEGMLTRSAMQAWLSHVQYLELLRRQELSEEGGLFDAMPAMI